jgi:uncharacterized membrane protein YdjX (TVP38/TMEM64 family)
MSNPAFNTFKNTKSMSKALVLYMLIILLIFIIFRDFESYSYSLLENLSQYPWVYAIASFGILASDIFLPIPSSVIMYLNGYVLGVLSGGILSLVSLMVCCISGYYIASFAAAKFQNKVNSESQFLLNKYGVLAILITRGMPILSESICLLCGYQKMNFRIYLLYNLIGYLPLCFLYAYFGELGAEKDLFLISFLLSLSIAAIFWWIGSRFTSRAMPLQGQNSTHT